MSQQYKELKKLFKKKKPINDIYFIVYIKNVIKINNNFLLNKKILLD